MWALNQNATFYFNISSVFVFCLLSLLVQWLAWHCAYKLGDSMNICLTALNKEGKRDNEERWPNRRNILLTQLYLPCILQILMKKAQCFKVCTFANKSNLDFYLFSDIVYFQVNRVQICHNLEEYFITIV